MINKISSKTCSEIYYILTELKQFKFNKNIPLQFQVKSKETRIVLSYIYLKYINKDENLKEFALNNYKSNELRYQEELHKKYNYDDLFKNRKMNKLYKEKNDTNEESLIEIKDNIIDKIIKKIRNIFKK